MGVGDQGAMMDRGHGASSSLTVPSPAQATVETAEDVLSMMAEGSRNRHSAETKMNERSSRSHQVRCKCPCKGLQASKQHVMLYCAGGRLQLPQPGQVVVGHWPLAA